jgi:hypothetical protein
VKRPASDIETLDREAHSAVPETEDVFMDVLTKKLDDSNPRRSAGASSATGLGTENFLEVLQAEVWDTEDDSQRFVSDLGCWCSQEEIDEADLRELCGLCDGYDMFRESTWAEVPKGSKVVDTRMVRRWKGDQIKSRLVARDFKHKAAEGGEYFAATPGQVGINIQLAASAQNFDKNLDDPEVMLIADVTQAFPHAWAEDRLWITFAKELHGLLVKKADGTFFVIDSAEPYLCTRALYGFRKSPTWWQEYLARLIATKCGLRRLHVEPTMFVDDQSGTIVTTYVDDLMFTGPLSKVTAAYDLLAMDLKLKKMKVLKEVGDSCNFVGRRITRVKDGYEVTCLEKIVDKLAQDLHLEGCSVVKTPSVKYTRSQLEKATPLPAEEIPFFRRVLGMELYLANQQRWLELQFPCTQAARGGAHPSTIDMWRVKRIAKYIVSHRATMSYLKDPTMEKLKAITDADWAGDPVSRRSTTGGLVIWRRCLLTSWSRTQRTIAMSSSEAEYYSLTTGLQEMLHARNVLCELQIDYVEDENGKVPAVELWTDSLGAKQGGEKIGALHQRHMELRYHFLKQMVHGGIAEIKKLPGIANPADMLTKSLCEAKLRSCIGLVCNYRVVEVA